MFSAANPGIGRITMHPRSNGTTADATTLPPAIRPEGRVRWLSGITIRHTEARLLTTTAAAPLQPSKWCRRAPATETEEFVGTRNTVS